METRYEKNIDEIFSEQLQAALLTKSIAVIGCGGQGGYVIEYLIRLGVKSLLIWDGDIFEESNLNRQIGCTLNTIGKNKAEIMYERCKEINPSTEVICFNHYFGLKNDDLDNIKKADIIINCTDVFVNVKMLRKLYRQIIIEGIPYMDCPSSVIGGFVCIETQKSIDHFDYQTEKLIEAFQENPVISQPAYKCALLAAEAVNQMVQYFDNCRYANVNSVLEINMYHHRYIEHDKYGTIYK